MQESPKIATKNMAGYIRFTEGEGGKLNLYIDPKLHFRPGTVEVGVPDDCVGILYLDPIRVEVPE